MSLSDFPFSRSRSISRSSSSLSAHMEVSSVDSLASMSWLVDADELDEAESPTAEPDDCRSYAQQALQEGVEDVIFTDKDGQFNSS